MNMTINNNISFQGIPGQSILAHAKKEFGKETKQVNQYVKLYSDTFNKNIDNCTIVNLTKDNKYIFSSTIFPNIEYVSDVILKTKDSILKALLNECPKTLSRIEIKFFRKIIAESIKQGTSIQDLNDRANLIKNKKSKKYFLENLNIAKCIINENPNAELSNQAFDAMSNKLMKEEAQTSGTELYDLIHNLNKVMVFK